MKTDNTLRYNGGMWIFRKPKTFQDVAQAVLKSKRLKSKNTQASAKREIERLIANLGHMRIRDITEDTWTEYILRERGKKERKFFDDRKYMRQVMLRALSEGLIDKKIKFEIPDVPSDVGREISQAEIDRLLEHADVNLTFQIQIALRMGLRLREMLHLQWDRFDWNTNTIVLKPEDTKTRRGRQVPIAHELINRFQELKYLSNSPYVFPSPKSPMRPQEYNKTAWRTCKKRANVKGARWHDLRHTCASRMLRANVRREVAKAVLGMSEKVLTEIYNHLSLSDLRTATVPTVEIQNPPDKQNFVYKQNLTYTKTPVFLPPPQ
jgi:integrase